MTAWPCHTFPCRSPGGGQEPPLVVVPATGSKDELSGMVISLNVSINIGGKELTSPCVPLLLSFRLEKELIQPRTHFPRQLYTTNSLIKMYFIFLQKSLFWELCSHKACCFLFLASFKRPGLAAFISECTRHMLQPSEHC